MKSPAWRSVPATSDWPAPGNDLIVKVWDLRTGKEALALDIVDRRANGLAFSPDGHRLAVGSADGVVQILDGTPLDGPGDAGQLLTLEGHSTRSSASRTAPTAGGSSRRAGTGPRRSGTPTRARAGVDVPRTPSGPHRGGLDSRRPAGRVGELGRDRAGLGRQPPVPRSFRPRCAGRAGVRPGVQPRRHRPRHRPPRRECAGVGCGDRTADGLHRARARSCPCSAWHSAPTANTSLRPEAGDNTVKVWDWQADTKQPVRTLTAPENIIRNPVFSPDGQRLVAVVATPARVWTWDMTDR